MSEIEFVDGKVRLKGKPLSYVPIQKKVGKVLTVVDAEKLSESIKLKLKRNETERRNSINSMKDVYIG